MDTLVSVVLSVLGVLLLEYLFVILGIGGTARYERMVSALSGRMQLLIDEVNKLQEQVKTTRQDTYPRLEAVEQQAKDLAKSIGEGKTT